MPAPDSIKGAAISPYPAAISACSAEIADDEWDEYLEAESRPSDPEVLADEYFEQGHEWLNILELTVDGDGEEV